MSKDIPNNSKKAKELLKIANGEVKIPDPNHPYNKGWPWPEWSAVPEALKKLLLLSDK